MKRSEMTTQERQGSRIEALASRRPRDPAPQDLAHERAHRPPRRLGRDADPQAQLSHPRGKPLRLRRGPGPVQTFECQKAPSPATPPLVAPLPHGSSSSCCRNSKRRAKDASSARMSRRARTNRTAASTAKAIASTIAE